MPLLEGWFKPKVVRFAGQGERGRGRGRAWGMGLEGGGWGWRVCEVVVLVGGRGGGVLGGWGAGEEWLGEGAWCCFRCWQMLGAVMRSREGTTATAATTAAAAVGVAAAAALLLLIAVSSPVHRSCGGGGDGTRSGAALFWAGALPARRGCHSFSRSGSPALLCVLLPTPSPSFIPCLQTTTRSARSFAGADVSLRTRSSRPQTGAASAARRSAT